MRHLYPPKPKLFFLDGLGPVVQSIVSLAKSLVNDSLNLINYKKDAEPLTLFSKTMAIFLHTIHLHLPIKFL